MEVLFLAWRRTHANSKARKLSFTSGCSSLSTDREAAEREYRSHSSLEAHAIYISARNISKYIFQLYKNYIIKRKCTLTFLVILKNISRFFIFISFTLPNQTESPPPLVFLKINRLLKIQPWMILCPSLY